MSPTQLEQKLISIEDSIARKMLPYSIYLHSIFILSVLLLCLTQELWFPNEIHATNSWFSLLFNSFHLNGVLILLIGAYLSLFLKGGLKKIFLVLLMIFVWIFLGLERNLELIFLVSLPALLLSNGVWLPMDRRSAGGRTLAVLWCLLSFVLFWVFTLFRAKEQGQSHEIIFSFNVLPNFLFFYLFILALQRAKVQLLTVMNPLSLFFPLPWPKFMTFEEKSGKLIKLQMQALLKLSQGVFWGLFVMLILSQKGALTETHPFLQGLYIYFLFLVGLNASLSIAIGLLWLFGYQTPVISYFALLAKSPLELWQRSATYLIRFLTFSVLFPWLAFLRSLWLGAFSFCILILFFLVSADPRFNLPFAEWLVRGTAMDLKLFLPRLMYLGTWMVLWALWMGVFFYLNKKLSNLQTAWWQWLCIIVTHLGSSQIANLAEWLSHFYI